MSRLTSAAFAMAAVCSIYLIIAYMVARPFAAFFEAIGALLALYALVFVISAVLGFVSGSIKKGSFWITFVYSFLITMPLCTLIWSIGTFEWL